MPLAKANREFDSTVYKHQAVTLTYFTPIVEIPLEIPRALQTFGWWLDPACEYWEAYPELTQNEMLHWHLYCRVKNFIRFWKFIGFWRGRYGKQVCVKAINHNKYDELRGWREYISKDWGPRSESQLSQGIFKRTAYQFIGKRLRNRLRAFDDKFSKHSWKRFVKVKQHRKEMTQVKSILDYGLYVNEAPEYVDIGELRAISV